VQAQAPTKLWNFVIKTLPVIRVKAFLKQSETFEKSSHPRFKALIVQIRKKSIAR